MKTNKKKHIDINDANLDSWLAITGFLFPTTENQLDLFDRLYEDYDYKLRDAHIDVGAILSNKAYSARHQVTPLFDNGVSDVEIQPLRMAARKGEKEIPDEIIQKMRRHHKKDDE